MNKKMRPMEEDDGKCLGGGQGAEGAHEEAGAGRAVQLAFMAAKEKRRWSLTLPVSANDLETWTDSKRQLGLVMEALVLSGLLNALLRKLGVPGS